MVTGLQNKFSKGAIFGLLFGFFLVIGGCVKNTNIAWLYYDETNCADRWTYTNNNEVLKDNITTYFKAKGVKIYEIEIFSDRVRETCSECTCETGRRIKCKVKERESSKMKSEGFYE